MNIYDILNRARSLKEEYRLDSVTPERLGALHEDTLKYINEYQLLASSPSLHKTYASVSAMQSDKSPKSDLTGKALKPGQLVVIVPANQSDATAGDVYRYDGPSGNTSAWTFVSKIGGVPADAELSATSTNPPQNKVVTEKLTELEEKTDVVDDVFDFSKNLVKSLENGYVLNNNSLTETGTDYYVTTNFVHIKAGQKVYFSVANNILFRVYIGKDKTSTGTGRLSYITETTGQQDGRYYAVYTATEDCVARMSCVNFSFPMIEISDADIPSNYEPYSISVNPSVFIPAIEQIDSELAEKASVIISHNLADFTESGYVTIQNKIVDAETGGYKTSGWINLKVNDSFIVSAEKNYVRIYIGRNKLPTTEGGSRIEFITEFTSTYSDGRRYVRYTASEDCVIRVSVYASEEKAMLEITDAETPSAYADYGNKLDPTIIVPKSLLSESLSPNGYDTRISSNWYGKNVLVIGDSLTAANIWQNKLHELLGMNVTTHAKGGIGFPAMLDGSPASTDDVSQANGELLPLSVTDVTGKDMIIIYGGYNHRGSADGLKGDLYPTVNSVYGCLQYLINGIYALLKTANNLSCRVIVITPHCAGRYKYIPFTWWEEYPSGSGRTGETLVSAIIKCANDNSVACLDLFHTSGINQFTWDDLSASNSAYDESGNVRDQLHLNASKGYPYLGTRISNWINSL